jgi:hypothetical protein
MCLTNRYVIRIHCCCIRPSPGGERLVDVIPRMDGVRTFWNKMGCWAGSTHLQIIPMSRVWSYNFIQILVTFLRCSADSIQLQHKATTIPFITIHMAHAIHLGCPYPNREKRKELSSFHARSAYWETKSINQYIELQKAYEWHNSAYHNPAEKKEEGKKTMSISHTATVSINYTTLHYISKPVHMLYLEQILNALTLVCIAFVLVL